MSDYYAIALTVIFADLSKINFQNVIERYFYPERRDNGTYGQIVCRKNGRRVVHVLDKQPIATQKVNGGRFFEERNHIVDPDYVDDEL